MERLSVGFLSVPVKRAPSELQTFVGRIRAAFDAPLTPDSGTKRNRLLHQDHTNWAKSAEECLVEVAAAGAGADALLRIGAHFEHAVRDLVARLYPGHVQAPVLHEVAGHETAVNGTQNVHTHDLLVGEETYEELVRYWESSRRQEELSRQCRLAAEQRMRDVVLPQRSA